MQLHSEHWTTDENESREYLLFLHGMGGTGKLWRPVASQLENEFHILAPDQRGHGKSLIPPQMNADYSPLAYGRDVIDTMEARHFSPVWLIGHSMGVRTAAAVFHLAPSQVRGMILIDLGFWGPAGGGLGETLADFLKILPAHFDSRTLARDFLNQNCPDPSIAQYLLAVAAPTGKKTAAGEEVQFPFEKNSLIKTIHAVRDFSFRPWIQEAGERNLPVLVLRGANSKVFDKKEYEKEREIFSTYPSILFEEVEGAGHGLPFEKRLFFIERLKSFIHRQSAVAGVQ